LDYIITRIYIVILQSHLSQPEELILYQISDKQYYRVRNLTVKLCFYRGSLEVNATVMKASDDRASQEFSVALLNMENTNIPINNVNYKATAQAVNGVNSEFNQHLLSFFIKKVK